MQCTSSQSMRLTQTARLQSVCWPPTCGVLLLLVNVPAQKCTDHPDSAWLVHAHGLVQLPGKYLSMQPQP
jgi:hypothetical protein